MMASIVTRTNCTTTYKTLGSSRNFWWKESWQKTGDINSRLRTKGRKRVRRGCTRVKSAREKERTGSRDCNCMHAMQYTKNQRFSCISVERAFHIISLSSCVLCRLLLYIRTCLCYLPPRLRDAGSFSLSVSVNTAHHWWDAVCVGPILYAYKPIGGHLLNAAFRFRTCTIHNRTDRAETRIKRPSSVYRYWAFLWTLPLFDDVVFRW